MKTRILIFFALACAVLLFGQATTSSVVAPNGVAGQRSNAGGPGYLATGTADTAGDITLRTATGFELYAVSVGGYVTAATGAGGIGALSITCGSLSAGSISAPTGIIVEQFTTGLSIALPPAAACFLKSGDTITYNFVLVNNVMGTMAARYSISAVRIN